MQCISIARGTGARCKNDATPGTPFCDVSQHNPRHPVSEDCQDVLASFLEAQDGEDNPPDAGTSNDPVPPAPDPEHSEPARAEFSAARGVGVGGEGAGPSLDIPRAPDPEGESAAQRPEPDRDVDEIASRIPPHIFRAAGTPGGGGEGRGDSSRTPGGPSSSHEPSRPRASAMRAAATPGTVGRVVIPTIDRGFKALGWAPLEPAEAEAGAEIIAAAMVDSFETLDPENPRHQLYLWLLFVVGSRAVPAVAGRVGQAARARMGLAGENGGPPDDDGEGGVRPGEDQLEDGPPGPAGETWSPLDVMP